MNYLISFIFTITVSFLFNNCASVEEKALQNAETLSHDIDILCPNLGILDIGKINKDAIVIETNEVAIKKNYGDRPKFYKIPYLYEARKIKEETDYLEFRRIYKEFCGERLPAFIEEIEFVKNNRRKFRDKMLLSMKSDSEFEKVEKLIGNINETEVLNISSDKYWPFMFSHFDSKDTEGENTLTFDTCGNIQMFSLATCTPDRVDKSEFEIERIRKSHYALKKKYKYLLVNEDYKFYDRDKYDFKTKSIEITLRRLFPSEHMGSFGEGFYVQVPSLNLHAEPDLAEKFKASGKVEILALFKIKGTDYYSASEEICVRGDSCMFNVCKECYEYKTVKKKYKRIKLELMKYSVQNSEGFGVEKL